MFLLLKISGGSGTLDLPPSYGLEYEQIILYKFTIIEIKNGFIFNIYIYIDIYISTKPIVHFSFFS
jgi:hypothetical protein